ncbi:MAG: hypothetical protein KA330_11415 [Chitinophagaceae bacterium]|nr:hypothetical protein [Chitinophagaceae bacterium]MBP6417058.1 hypothetical protein [Chitinophagaceae bacterium]
MTRFRFILIAIILFLNSPAILSQSVSRYNTFSYNVNEGLLQSTIGDIEFDRNNFCWLSFPNGIQKFDGKNFITVPVQPGLPDDKLCIFFRCSNGDLLISHSKGISKYEISGNRFRQFYTNSPGINTPVQFIGEDDGIIYIYTQAGIIKAIDSQTLKVVSAITTGFPNHSSDFNYRPQISNIINHRVVLLINSSLCLWDLKNGKLLFQSAPVPGISGSLLHLKNEQEILFNMYTLNGILQLYNFTSNTTKPFAVKGSNGKYMSRCDIYTWQNKILIFLNDRIYETDSALQSLNAELVNYQNLPVSANSTIARLKEDNFGNLYIQTVTGGIKKIIRQNYPIKYYNSGDAEKNFILCIYPDKKNNRILAGTSGHGIFIFDTVQQLVKQVTFANSKGTPSSINCIFKNNEGDYILFGSGHKLAWKLNSDLSRISTIPFNTSLADKKSGTRFFGNFILQNDREAVIQTQERLYRLNFKKETIDEHIFASGYIMGGLYYNPFIISHVNDELIFLDASTFKEVKKIPFKNTAFVRCFAKDNLNNIYVGSNKGVFKIDSNGKILQQLNKETGLPDECIYAMAFDEEGFLWCSTNKGILKVNKDNKVVLQLKKEDGMQENEFNTNVVAKSDDGELFFGGVNGLNSFYPSAIGSFEEKLNILFTRIRANNEDVIKDTATWNITSIKLPYINNNLSFDFVAMGTNNPNQYIYQYKMEGVDKEWIQNNEIQTVRYSLPPGKYTFKIYASRSFNTDATAMKEIRIVIQPPFWKTWWFLTAISLAFISILAYLINQKNKKKYAKKLQLLENERQLKQERERISKDLHDSLGAYANAVLYNTELLEKEKIEEKRKDLIGDLKFASKDIITSLRETVWALKKETYTAEDCLVRVRNFIQPFAKYYSHISFRVEGEAPSGMELHYTKALNLVRIMQEAISNSIKHASPNNIHLTSNVTDNNWQLIIADDGKGFDYAAMKKQERGNGLDNIEHRAAESGFNLSIQAAEKKGTIITIII